MRPLLALSIAFLLASCSGGLPANARHRPGTGGSGGGGGEGGTGGVPPCSDGDRRYCGEVTSCGPSEEVCAEGVWGPCGRPGGADTCNGFDDDCNGTIDDGASNQCGGSCELAGLPEGPCNFHDICLRGAYVCNGLNHVVCEKSPAGQLDAIESIANAPSATVVATRELESGAVVLGVNAIDGIRTPTGQVLAPKGSAVELTYPTPGSRPSVRKIATLATTARLLDATWEPDGSSYMLIDSTTGSRFHDAAGADVEGPSEGVVLLRYDEAGRLTWARQVGNRSDGAARLTRYSGGGAVVVEVLDGGDLTAGPGQPNERQFHSPAYRSGVVSRWSSAGEMFWARQVGPMATSTLALFSLATFPGGNVLLGGGLGRRWTFGVDDPDELTFRDDLSPDAEFFLLRLSGNGEYVWHRRAGGQGGTVRSLSVDAEERIAFQAAAGDLQFDPGEHATGFASLIFGSLEGDGQVRWVRAVVGDIAPSGVAALPDGSLYLTAYSQGRIVFGRNELFETVIDTSESAVVARVGPDGNLLWAQGTNGGRYNVVDAAPAPTAAGGVVMAGKFENAMEVGRCGSERRVGQSDQVSVFMARFDP